MQSFAKSHCYVNEKANTQENIHSARYKKNIYQTIHKNQFLFVIHIYGMLEELFSWTETTK